MLGGRLSSTADGNGLLIDRGRNVVTAERGRSVLGRLPESSAWGC
jgi:hypothetical protein